MIEGEKNDPREAPEDQSSAHPPNWPGIPGRSEQREGSAREAEVTESQRELEEEVHHAQRR